jgi:hypothetical protein
MNYSSVGTQIQVFLNAKCIAWITNSSHLWKLIQENDLFFPLITAYFEAQRFHCLRVCQNLKNLIGVVHFYKYFEVKSCNTWKTDKICHAFKRHIYGQTKSFHLWQCIKSYHLFALYQVKKKYIRPLLKSMYYLFHTKTFVLCAISFSGTTSRWYKVSRWK